MWCVTRVVRLHGGCVSGEGNVGEGQSVRRIGGSKRSSEGEGSVTRLEFGTEPAGNWGRWQEGDPIRVGQIVD